MNCSDDVPSNQDDQPPLPTSWPALPLHAPMQVLNDATATLGQHQHALKQLAPLLGRDPAVLMWFIHWVRRCTQSELLYHALSVLAQVRVQASVSLLCDVALGVACDYFEKHPEDYTHLMQHEEVIRLRCQAVKLLGFLENPQASVVLMELLNHRGLNYRIRLEAAEALGRLRQPQALNPLIQILKDEREPSLYLKESAAKALGLLGDIRAIEPLMDVFEAQQGFRKKCEFVVEQLVTSLGKLLPLGGEKTFVSEQTQHKVHHHLIHALEDEASSIRIAALEALGELGDTALLPMIQAKLWDTHMDVAHTALASVYKLGALPALQALLMEETLPHFLREEILEFILLEAQEDLEALDAMDDLLEGVDDAFLHDPTSTEETLDSLEALTQTPDSFSFEAWKTATQQPPRPEEEHP
ncbi:MAG: HEAT repeat domain-containing protein [Vampirovibrionales bacterium]